MKTVLLLLASNIFMTFAWYGHLKYRQSPLWIAIAVSWLIALVVFSVFSVLYLKEGLRWNYLAGFACIVAAVFFVFKKW